MLVTILALLFCVTAVGWLLVGPRPRSAPGPLAPEHEVSGLPPEVVARWVWAHQPGLAAPAVAALVLLACAGFLVGDWENVAEGYDSDLAMLCVLGLLLGAAVLAVWAHLRFRVPPFIRALREQPELVVWAYQTHHHAVSERGVETGTVVSELTLCLADGRVFGLPTAGLEVDACLVALRRLNPRIITRYSDALRRAYEASPGSLAAERG